MKKVEDLTLRIKRGENVCLLDRNQMGKPARRQTQKKRDGTGRDGAETPARGQTDDGMRTQSCRVGTRQNLILLTNEATGWEGGPETKTTTTRDMNYSRLPREITRDSFAHHTEPCLIAANALIHYESRRGCKMVRSQHGYPCVEGSGWEL